MIIGITGTDGAGKGLVVEYLVSQHGFTHYSARDFITIEIERLGLPVDRNQLRLTANALRAEFGDEVVVRKAYERAAAEGRDRVVIESLRAMAEVEYLKLREGVLLAIDADPQIRYTRIQGRKSATDQVTFEEFLAHENLESNDPDPHGMQKSKVMAAADYTIMNNGSHAELYIQVEAFMNKFAGR
jgi:dephospho-CoA kinase